MVMPMVNQYLGDVHRKFRIFARRWWLLLSGLPWALGTADQVINCNADTLDVPLLSQAQLFYW